MTKPNKESEHRKKRSERLKQLVQPAALPQPMQHFLITVAGITQFAAQFFKEVWKPPYEFSEVLKQAYNLGVNSLSLVSISGFIMGIVLTLQTRPTLAEFGAESYIPAMVSIAIIREIGPVITAMICAGKVGSGIGAELGSMKVTEQIDAMEVSGTNPFNYLVITRVLAITVMLPLLVFYTDAIGLIGSYVGVNIQDDVSLSLFFTNAMDSVTFVDIVSATTKSFFFGFAIGIVGCYKGYHASKGTVGVGAAANSAVVIASLLIFIIDMIAVQITQFFI